MTAQNLFKEALGERRYDLDVVGFAHRHLTHDSPARRYLTTAIFPVYILHQTVIVVTAHALKPSHLYPPVEGVLLVLVTVATCFLGYEAIRRVPLLRPVFGLERGARNMAPERVAERAARRGGPVAQRVATEHGVPQDVN